jgi:hypothetical protein
VKISPKRPKRPKRRAAEIKIAPKQADILQLRVLKRVIQSGLPLSDNRKFRARLVQALSRIIENKYPPRARNRPRKDERNFRLAVGYHIRLMQPKARKSNRTIVSEDLSAEYAEKLDIRLDAIAIRKLPAQHRDAEREAESLIDEASDFATRGFADPYDAAFHDVCDLLRIIEATKED